MGSESLRGTQKGFLELRLALRWPLKRETSRESSGSMSGEAFHFLMFVLQLSLGGVCLAGITELTLESSIYFPLPSNRKAVLQE